MKSPKLKFWNTVGWLIFYMYILCLGYFLFFSERYGRDLIADSYQYNLELFKEIRRFIQYRDIIGTESFIVNIIGNVLAFAPFGFLLPLLNQRYRKFFYVMLLSIIFSFGIETIQMYYRVGIFDVDDIFMNTLGGIIGYTTYSIFRIWFISSKKRKV